MLKPKEATPRITCDAKEAEKAAPINKIQAPLLI